MPAILSPGDPTRKFVNIESYGAVATGGDSNAALNSAAIQAAVDAMVATGGGTVFIPACREDGANGYYLQHPVWINGDNIAIRGNGDRASVLKSRGPVFVVNRNPIKWTTRNLWTDVDGTITYTRDLPAGTSWEGVWDSGTTYSLNDLVVHNGITYKMILSPGTTTVAPSTNTDPDYWVPFTDQSGDWIVDDGRYRTDLTRFRWGGSADGVPLAGDLSGPTEADALVGGPEYKDDAFALRTRARALARYPYHPLATGNNRPDSGVNVGGWENHTQATFEFIFYWHGGNLHGGICGVGSINKPDPWILCGSHDSGELIFSFALTDNDRVEKTLVWAKIAAPGAVGLHRVCFQVDLAGDIPRVTGFLNKTQVAVTFSYPDVPGFTQSDGTSFGVRWNRFASWESHDFTLGSASYYVGKIAGEDFSEAATFPDLSFVACTVYLTPRYAATDRVPGDPQVRAGTLAAYSDLDVIGQSSTVRTNSLGCIHNATATFPVDDPQTAIGMGSYSQNNFIWGYMCPDGTGASGNADAIKETTISNLKTANQDSIGYAYSCDILVGKYLMLRMRHLATTGAKYASLGVMNAAAVYSAFVDDCELLSMVHVANTLAYLRNIQFGYVPRCAVLMSGAQFYLDGFLCKEPGGYARAFLVDYAHSSLSSGIILRNGTINWESEASPVRIAMIYTQKRAYHSNTSVDVQNVVFGETAGVPTFYLDDYIEQLDHPAYIHVRRCGLPGRAPIACVRGKDWRGSIEIDRENWFEHQVVQLPSYESANYTTDRLKTVMRQQWSLPPGGGFKAAGHEVQPVNPPEGGVSLWGVKTGGIEGSATPPVFRPLSFAPSFRKHATSANVGPAMHVRCNLEWPTGSTTTIEMTCLTSPNASKLLAHLLTGASAFTRSHVQVAWGAYIPYFGADNTLNNGYSVVRTDVLDNTAIWSSAASSSKSNSGNVAIVGRNHGWTGVDWRRKLGVSVAIGASGSALPVVFAGKTAPVPTTFWDATDATSFNVSAGNLIAAGSTKSGSFTHYGMNKLLDHVFGGSSLGLSGPWYFGLSTTPIAADGSGITEPSGGSYARVSVALNGTNWHRYGASPSNVWSNAIDIEWPAPTGNWGECLYMFASDASTAGNVVMKAPLNWPVTVMSGDSAVIMYADALQIQA